MIDAAQHLGLVYSVTNSMKRWAADEGVEEDDLIGEGSVALVRAARDFDPSRGLQFSTLAVNCIRNAIFGLVKGARANRLHKPRKGDNSELDYVGVEDRGADRHFRLAEMLAGLREKHRRVLTLRFGLEGGDGMTLAEVGQHMGVTGERVRQIEARALSCLREWMACAVVADGTAN